MTDETGTAAAAASGGADAAAAQAAAAAAAASKPWFDGKADAETVGYFQNRGWDKLDAAAVALEASKAHRAAEKFLGAPSNELVRLPKDANDPAWRSVYQRVNNAPDDPKGYDFSGVKFTNGDTLEEPFTQALAAAAYEAHVGKDGAPTIARAVVKFLETQDAAAAAEKAAVVAKQKDALTKNWGSNFNVNKIVASNAANALGVSEAELNSLQDQIGYDRVMEMFRSIGSRIGEDKFVTNGSGAGNGVMTREQAVARKAELMADKAWVTKLLSGDAEAKRLEDNISRLISGV